MSTTTSNMGLTKPSLTDLVEDTIPALSNNFQTIDDKFGILSKNQVSILTFGADPTGISNSTTAIKNAISFAQSQGIKKVFAPKGTYLLDAASYLNTGNAISIPAGISLEGDRADTVFKVNPSSVATDNTDYLLFLLDPQGKCRNFTIDGNRGNISRTGLTNVGFHGIRFSTVNGAGYEVSDLWIHDIIGVNKESFGIHTQAGANKVKYQRIEAWNIEGTGIHVSGDYGANNLMNDVDVIDCRLHDNTFMGISCYGATKVRLRGIHAYNNVRGINLEWATEIDMYDCILHDNTQAGIGTFGKSSFRVYDSNLTNNNTTNYNYGGEISLNVGEWWQGSPLPRAIAGTVEIHNTTITPSGRPHIYIEADDAVNVGDSIPDSILINTADGKDWTIKVMTSDGAQRTNSYLPCLSYGNVKTMRPLFVGKLSGFSTAGATIATYSSTDNVDADAVTITSTSQFSNIFYNGYTLKKGRRYLVKVRFKPTSSGKWSLIEKNQSSTNGRILNLGYGTLDQNKWYKAEAIFIPTEDARIQIQCDSTGTNTLVVDYLSVVEMLSDTEQSKTLLIGTNQIDGNTIFHSGNRFTGKTTAQATWGNVTISLSAAQTQPDTGYWVQPSVEWNAGAVWTDSKTTTSFRINWATSPTASAIVGWEIIR